METRFVYFFYCEVDTAFSLLYQHSSDTNLHFRGQTDVIKKNKTYFNVIFGIILQLDLQKACWSHQVEREVILFKA